MRVPCATDAHCVMSFEFAAEKQTQLVDFVCLNGFTKHYCAADGGQPAISLFPKEITMYSGIVWSDRIYGDRRQMCESVEVSMIKYQLFRRPKMKYLLFTLNL